MEESKELSEARDRLAKAESKFTAAEGLAHLREGLALLERVIDDVPASGDSGTVAFNLGQSYTARIYDRIQSQVDSNRAIPEPELEHFFAVIRAFDETRFDAPPNARGLKIGVVKRLVDLYSEGYSPSKKQLFLEALESYTEE